MLIKYQSIYYSGTASGRGDLWCRQTQRKKRRFSGPEMLYIYVTIVPSVLRFAFFRNSYIHFQIKLTKSNQNQERLRLQSANFTQSI